MCIKLKNKYGYKVCYTTKTNKRKYITESITDRYTTAQIIKEINIKHQDKKDKRDWYILPIKKKEYKKLWKDCPF